MITGSWEPLVFIYKPLGVTKSIALYFTGHESGELDILREDIEHDDNCLLKGLIDNQLSLPQINRDGEFINRDGEFFYCKSVCVYGV